MTEINPRMGNYKMEKKEHKRWFDMQKINLPRNCYIIPLNEWTDREIVLEWFNRVMHREGEEDVSEYGPTDNDLRNEIQRRADEQKKEDK
jgi:hypothetical protein